MTSADDWPNRPIRFVVCFPAGGSTDVASRILGEYVSRSLGQQIYVENRGGDSGYIGIEAAVKSAPDDYTSSFAPTRRPATRTLMT